MVLAGIAGVDAIKTIDFTPSPGMTLEEAKVAGRELRDTIMSQLGQTGTIEVLFLFGGRTVDVDEP